MSGVMTKRSAGEFADRQRMDATSGDGHAVLSRLADHEADAVLRALLQRHVSLRMEAEQLATELANAPSLDDIARSVCEAVTSLDLVDLNDRAGATRWGYTEPTEAAWELLGESVEDFVADLKRRADLGLMDAAVIICRGIVAGLYKAKDSPSDGPLGWAPDFLAEEAGHAVAELLRASPDRTRDTIRTRLMDAIAADAPDWAEMLKRAAGREV